MRNYNNIVTLAYVLVMLTLAASLISCSRKVSKQESIENVSLTIDSCKTVSSYIDKTKLDSVVRHDSAVLEQTKYDSTYIALASQDTYSIIDSAYVEQRPDGTIVSRTWHTENGVVNMSTSGTIKNESWSSSVINNIIDSLSRKNDVNTYEQKDSVSKDSSYSATASSVAKSTKTSPLISIYAIICIIASAIIIFAFRKQILRTLKKLYAMWVGE